MVTDKKMELLKITIPRLLQDQRSGGSMGEHKWGNIMFTLKIKTDNAWFADGSKADAVALILRELAKKIEYGNQGSKILDPNGNTIGSYTLT